MEEEARWEEDREWGNDTILLEGLVSEESLKVQQINSLKSQILQISGKTKYNDIIYIGDNNLH